MAPESREFNKKIKPTVTLLKDSPGNSAGDIVSVRAVTDRSISYYDGMGRWCYLWASEEGELWQWLKRPTEDM